MRAPASRRRLDGRARARARGGRRSPFALPAYHRAGDAVLRCTRGQARGPRRGQRTCALRHDPVGMRGAGFPAYEISNHARPGGNAGTISFIGVRTNSPASARAHTADSTSTATAMPPQPRRRPEAWLMRVEALGHGLVTDEPLTPEQLADEFLLMGLRLAEGVDPARYARLAGRPLDPSPHRAAARARRGRNHHRAACCGLLSPAFPCSMPWSPTWRREHQVSRQPRTPSVAG